MPRGGSESKWAARVRAEPEQVTRAAHSQSTTDTRLSLDLSIMSRNQWRHYELFIIQYVGLFYHHVRKYEFVDDACCFLCFWFACTPTLFLILIFLERRVIVVDRLAVFKVACFSKYTCFFGWFLNHVSWRTTLTSLRAQNQGFLFFSQFFLFLLSLQPWIEWLLLEVLSEYWWNRLPNLADSSRGLRQKTSLHCSCNIVFFTN